MSGKVGFNKEEFLNNTGYRQRLYDSYLAEREDISNFTEFLDTILDDCKNHKEKYKKIYNKLFREKNKIIEEEVEKIQELAEERIKRETWLKATEITQRAQKEAMDANNKYYKKVIEISNLEQKLKETAKMVDEWKAMFTEQALANAKLINNGGTQCQKNTTDGN